MFVGPTKHCVNSSRLNGARVRVPSVERRSLFQHVADVSGLPVTGLYSGQPPNAVVWMSTAFENSRFFGAPAYSDTMTLDECKAECETNFLCGGIDYNPTITTKCWLVPENRGEETQDAPGFTHYSLSRVNLWCVQFAH